jgi:hypothetical protein
MEDNQISEQFTKMNKDIMVQLETFHTEIMNLKQQHSTLQNEVNSVRPINQIALEDITLTSSTVSLPQLKEELSSILDSKQVKENLLSKHAIRKVNRSTLGIM